MLKSRSIPLLMAASNMTISEEIALRKLSLLDLASELSNVSRACKVMGCCRQQFYEVQLPHLRC